MKISLQMYEVTSETWRRNETLLSETFILKMCLKTRSAELREERKVLLWRKLSHRQTETRLHHSVRRWREKFTTCHQSQTVGTVEKQTDCSLKDSLCARHAAWEHLMKSLLHLIYNQLLTESLHRVKSQFFYNINNLFAFVSTQAWAAQKT